MSTDQKPGMAVNEEKVAQHVSETRQQAEDANYPRKPVPLHEKAKPTRPAGTARRRDEST